MDLLAFESRMDIRKKIMKILKKKDFNAEYGKFCMNSNAVKSKFELIEKIGQGTFGVVYDVVFRDGDSQSRQLSAIVKETPLTEKEYDLAKKKIYPKEYLINKIVNNVVIAKINPNFVLTYSIMFCDKCPSLRAGAHNIERKCAEMFMEKMDNDLLSFSDYFVEEGSINSDMVDLMMLSCCFQVFSALDVLHRKCGISHNDIKADNILVKILPSGALEGGVGIRHYSKYAIEGNDASMTPDFDYFVPIIGAVPYISDFGESAFLKPDDNIEPLLISAPTYGKERYAILNSRKVKKIPTNQLSRKELKDVESYPPVEFSYDIDNLILTFIGGPRVGKPGTHPFLGNLNIKNVLQKHANRRGPANFLACRLLYDVFSPIFHEKPDRKFKLDVSYSPYENDEESVIDEIQKLRI